MFDGTLARATGKASKFGAFMDSVFDAGRRGLVYLGASPGAAALADVGDGAGPRRRGRHGCRVHGQLHAREVRGLGFSSGIGPGRGRHHAARDPARDHLARHRPRPGRASAPSAIEFALGDHPRRRRHHRHPADPPRPQPGQVDRHHPRPSKENGETRGNQRQERQATARTARRRPTPGPAPAAAATARSGSPSSASATARAASSRAATTTRTPRRTTSSRA